MGCFNVGCDSSSGPAATRLARTPSPSPRSTRARGAKSSFLCAPSKDAVVRFNCDSNAVHGLWYLLIAGLVMFVTSIGIAAEPLQLTRDGRQKSSPVFRDGGREVVYADFTDAALFQLRRVVLADGTDERLHAKSTTAEFEPAWSADGECYAFCKLRGVLSVGLTVCDKKGNTLHEILPGGGFAGYRSPALSPDHSRLLFASAERGTQQICSSRLDGQDRKLLTDTTGINNWPAYSQDGRSIVFGSSRDGNFEIYRMTAEGTEVRRLTEHPLQDIRPRFSPDGLRIAFTSHRDGNAEIYVMSGDGTGLQRITENEGRDDYAEWHPDGKRLVIVSEREGKHDLYLVEVK